MAERQPSWVIPGLKWRPGESRESYERRRAAVNAEQNRRMAIHRAEMLRMEREAEERKRAFAEQSIERERQREEREREFDGTRLSYNMMFGMDPKVSRGATLPHSSAPNQMPPNSSSQSMGAVSRLPISPTPALNRQQGAGPKSIPNVPDAWDEPVKAPTGGTGGAVLSGDPRETGLSTAGSGSNDNMVVAMDRLNNLNSFAPQQPLAAPPDPMDMPVVAPTAASPMAPPNASTASTAPVQRPTTGASPVRPSNSSQAPSQPDYPGIPTTAGFEIPTSYPQMLDLIGRYEGTTDQKAQENGYASAYDIPLGYGRFDPLVNGIPATKARPVSTMTLNEVLALQEQIRQNSKSEGFNSGAIGKYQIIGTTLRGLIKNMGLSGNEVFSPELQDAMAMALLNGRGYTKFINGEIDADTFFKELVSEWQGFETVGAEQNTSNGSAGNTVGNRPDFSSILQSAQGYNAEIDALYQQMKNGVQTPMDVRDPMESALASVRRVMTAKHGTEDLSGAIDAEKQYDDGVLQYNNQIAQQEMANLVSMADRQRQYLDQMYDSYRGRANEEELRVFQVVESLVANIGTRTAVFGELEARYGDRLLTFSQTQLAAEVQSILKEKGWPIDAPLSAVEQSTVNRNNAAAAKSLSDIDGATGNELSYLTNEKGITPTERTRLSAQHIRIKQGYPEVRGLFDVLLGSLEEGGKLSGAGTPGIVSNFLVSLDTNVERVMEELTGFNNVGLISDSFKQQIDGLAQNNADLAALYTQLTFSLARQVAGGGVLSDQDFNNARNILGDPNAWLETPERMLGRAIANYTRQVEKEYNESNGWHESLTGKPLPYEKPDMSDIVERAKQFMSCTTDVNTGDVTTTEPPMINTQEQYNALPPGTQYRHPDGSLRIKG